MASTVRNGGVFGVKGLVVAAGFVSEVPITREKGDGGFIDVVWSL